MLLDLFKDEQWAMVVSKKNSKAFERQHICNAISAILGKDFDDTAQLTNFETETITLAVEHEVVPLAGTRSARPYLKDYGTADVGPSKSSEKANEKLGKQPSDKEKQKELMYNEALRKDATKKHISSFQFYVFT